jgi:hypothetical protein
MERRRRHEWVDVDDQHCLGGVLGRDEREDVG